MHNQIDIKTLNKSESQLIPIDDIKEIKSERDARERKGDKSVQDFNNQNFGFREILFKCGLVMAIAILVTSTLLVSAWFVAGICCDKVPFLPSSLAIAYVSALGVQFLGLILVIAKSVFPKDDGFIDRCKD